MRLREYLDRTGVIDPIDATIETLRRLHVAHRETFLFENLAIQEGGAISVELEAIERKFLDERRGGYCFEQNTLFAAMLRECGFECRTLLGRVRRGPPESWARTHMVLAVQVEPVAVAPQALRRASPKLAGRSGERRRQALAERFWLADVGFGAIGLVEPMPLRDGAVSHDRGLTYELRREAHLWMLSMRDASQQTMELYEFSEEPQTPADVVVANHYTSTHPDSIFRRSLTIQGVRGNDRIILRSGVLTRYLDGVLRERPVHRGELAPLARELFGVELPDRPLLYEADTVNA